MSLYQLHGLVIDAPFALPALGAPSGAVADLQAVWEALGSSPVPSVPAEQVIASSDVAGARYSAWLGESGLCCSYPELGEVTFDSLGRVLLRTNLQDAESGPALLSGSALALWLVARGELVLHASAVAWGSLGIAVVGASSAGKTTLAAQCVLAGARLVSDDVLRVELDDHAARWHAGTRWLRLRSGSRPLVDAWGGACYESPRDGRSVMTPARDDGPRSGQLSALVFPRHLPGAGGVSVERLSAGEALRRLVQAPRVRGLKAPALLEAQLRQTAQLSRLVPAFEVQLPSGPPFHDDTPLALRAELTRLVSPERA